MLGNRSLRTLMAAPFQKRQYIALINMWRNGPGALAFLYRYLTGKGAYPWNYTLRTPVGPVQVEIYTHHDLLTVNEIFFRRDYQAEESLRHVVDVGSNIGISALYFLTRNAQSTCDLYEPDERNITKLKKTLAGYENRYTLHPVAVSDYSGQVRFGREQTGRYGGIYFEAGEFIEVRCEHINQVLQRAIDAGHRIDILKADIEGAELQVARGIDPDYYPHISRMYLEWKGQVGLPAEQWREQAYGGVVVLENCMPDVP